MSVWQPNQVFSLFNIYIGTRNKQNIDLHIEQSNFKYNKFFVMQQSRFKFMFSLYI